MKNHKEAGMKSRIADRVLFTRLNERRIAVPLEGYKKRELAKLITSPPLTILPLYKKYVKNGGSKIEKG